MAAKHIALNTILCGLVLFAFICVPSVNQFAQAEEAVPGNASSMTALVRLDIPSIDAAKKMFGSEKIDKALALPGVVDVQFYYGKDQNGRSGYVMHSVDNRGNKTIASIGPGCLKCLTK